MNIKCPKCGYKWDYKGKSEYYVSCPKCRYGSIDIRKLKKSK